MAMPARRPEARATKLITVGETLDAAADLGQALGVCDDLDVLFAAIGDVAAHGGTLEAAVRRQEAAKQRDAGEMAL